MTILTVCWASSSLGISPEGAVDILRRTPSAAQSEKYWVGEEGKEGWLIHNAFRELAINQRLNQCATSQPSTDPLPPVTSILTEAPPRDSAKKQFFPDPADPANGWWVHNQYRESRINLELHRCAQQKSKALPACKEEKAPAKAFYENPTFAAISFFVGAYVGYWAAVRPGRP